MKFKKGSDDRSEKIESDSDEEEGRRGKREERWGGGRRELEKKLEV